MIQHRSTGDDTNTRNNQITGILFIPDRSFPLRYSRFANRIYNMNLKPQDIVVLLKLIAQGREERPGYAALSVSLGMSPSEVHAGVKRLINAKLVDSKDQRPMRKPVQEFLIHGVKYAFPPQKGAITIGYPTGFAASPLNQLINMGTDLPPVWPSAKGPVKGQAFTPLYKSVPDAIQNDPLLYELLALLDAIRDGRAREREIAAKELTRRIEHLV
ncbi:hypothetical protein [Marispirochaeta sp.]|uniref:hypothetical protein n=1 Tax=Marispirochaeta sp. TaxID=2038653 RepID=UPI0029C758A5|nr:hypothetical protein [Marispirochaeta sp.]